MTPEAKARQQIDAMLVASGWVIQDYKALNLSAGPGIALREVPLKSGPCDYHIVMRFVRCTILPSFPSLKIWHPLEKHQIHWQNRGF